MRVTLLYCTANKESLILSWVQLAEQVPVLAAWVADAPSEMLPILDEVTMLEVKLLFPEYQQIHPEVHVRIADLPVVDSIRDIRWGLNILPINLQPF